MPKDDHKTIYLHSDRYEELKAEWSARMTPVRPHRDMYDRPPTYGRDHRLSRAEAARLNQIGAASFNKNIEKGPREDRLRFLHGTGMPAELTGDHVGFERRLVNRTTEHGVAFAPGGGVGEGVYSRTVLQIDGDFRMYELLPIELIPPSPSPPLYLPITLPSWHPKAKPVFLQDVNYCEGGNTQEMVDESDEEVEHTKLTPLPAHVWNTWLIQKHDGKPDEPANPPLLRVHGKLLDPVYPDGPYEGCDHGSLDRAQFVHWTNDLGRAKMVAGSTYFKGERVYGLCPFFPEGKVTNPTPWEVIWLAINDYEGNVAAANHVLKEFPHATTYHRFVVSVEMSREILLDPFTRSHVGPIRANEFRKYAHPIDLKHLTESRCEWQRGSGPMKRRGKLKSC